MNDKKDFGYYLGRAFGITLTLCLMAIAISVTAKIIMWIL